MLLIQLLIVMRVWQVFCCCETTHLYATAVATLCCRRSLVPAHDVTYDVTTDVPEVGVGHVSCVAGLIVVVGTWVVPGSRTAGRRRWRGWVNLLLGDVGKHLLVLVLLLLRQVATELRSRVLEPYLQTSQRGDSVKIHVSQCACVTARRFLWWSAARYVSSCTQKPILTVFILLLTVFIFMLRYRNIRRCLWIKHETITVRYTRVCCNSAGYCRAELIIQTVHRASVCLYVCLSTRVSQIVSAGQWEM